jgi:hypothetical protein
MSISNVSISRAYASGIFPARRSAHSEFEAFILFPLSPRKGPASAPLIVPGMRMNPAARQKSTIGRFQQE